MNEGERWSSVALSAADEVDADERVRVITIASEFARYSGEHARAIELKRRGLGLAREIGDDLKLATLLDDLAPILAAIGQFAEAHACVDEALPIRRKHADEDPIGVPHTLSSAADIALREGNAAMAARLVAEITECEKAIDLHPDGIVESTWLAARTLLANDRVADADALFRQLVAEADTIAFLWPIIDSLNALARLAAEQDPERAARLLGMADRIHAESRLAAWDPAERDQTAAAVRATLGDEAFVRLRSVGHALPISAVAEAAGARTSN